MTYRVGVDLGTTYASAAVVRGDGRPEVVALGNRGTVIPSIVLVADDGQLLVGEAAIRRAATEPHRVIREFKRRIGDPKKIERSGYSFSAEELMGEMLQAVLKIVNEREGGPPDHLVLTHPANWSDYKLNRLLDEFKDLSLPPFTTLTEPDAAALSYAQRRRVEPGGVVAVYDLGGGTFDAAVLRRTADSFEVIGRPTGIERLGGIDFDTAVMAHVNRYLDGVLDHVDRADPLVAAGMARLLSDVVDAKEALSSEPDVTIPVYLPGLRTEVRLTRVEFEAMIRPSLQDTIGAVRRALTSAQVTASDLQAVLLVGGSSRIPLVAQLVGAELGRPVAVDAHPKHAVVLGAAVSARVETASREAATAVAAAPRVRRPQPPSQGVPTAKPPSTAPVANKPASIPTPPFPRTVDPAKPSVPTVAPAQRRPTVSGPARTTFEPTRAAAQAATSVTPSTKAPTSRAPQPSQRSRTGESTSLDSSLGARSSRGLYLAAVAAVAAIVAAVGFVIANQGGQTEDPNTGSLPSTPTTIEVAGSETTATTVSTTAAPSTVPSTAAPTTVPVESLAVAPVPVDCTPEGQRFVCITSIAVDDVGNIVAEYDPTGFVPFRGTAPNRHVHFFFPVGNNADDPQNAGTGTESRGSWIAWDDAVFGPGGQSAGYTIFDAIEVGATELCALVADANHEVTVGTGNCAPLPAESLG